MANSYFQFKQFTIRQDKAAMKVTTDSCLFGAWVAEKVCAQKLKHDNVLDLGCGTGLLSLMFAQKNLAAVVDAIEIDQTAFLQAAENIAHSPFSTRIHPIHHDVRDWPSNKRYDLVISNPPFYERELKSPDENKNLAHHGDKLSFRELFAVIKDRLAESGFFFLLLPFKRYNEIGKLFPGSGLMQTAAIFLRQSAKHDYFRVILEGRPGVIGNSETEISEISIWNDQQQYTDEFTQLLQDYYLYL